MTRVLYFSRDYTPHDHRFLSSLARTGFEIFYLRLEERQPALEKRSLPDKIHLLEWAGGGQPVEFDHLHRLLGDLEQIIREVDPDLVHAGPIQTAAFLVAQTGFQPLVSMSWGYDLLLDADRSTQLWEATRYTLQHSTVLVGDCQAVRHKAVAIGMPPERILTFPWGVDLEAFTPLSNARTAKPTFTMLSTRSWEPLYGVERLAQAFVRAAQERPEIHLCMLGDGSQAGEIKSILERGGVTDRVLFPGLIDQASLPDYYRSADLYVSTSHTDGSSVSLLEAFACGVPVLVTDIPGNREWVDPGVQGWLFPDDDVDALARGMVLAVEQRRRLPEMGLAARQIAERRADWSMNFDALLDAYKLALKVRTPLSREREP